MVRQVRDKPAPSERSISPSSLRRSRSKPTSIVMATGFELTPLDAKKEYGAGKLRNVIDRLMMERCWRPPALTGASCAPATARSQAPSPTSSAPARATRRWA